MSLLSWPVRKKKTQNISLSHRIWLGHSVRALYFCYATCKKYFLSFKNLSETCTVAHPHWTVQTDHLLREANIFWFKNHLSHKLHTFSKSKDKVWDRFYCLCSVGTHPTSWQSCRNLWSSHWSLSLWSHCLAWSRFWFPLWVAQKYRNDQKLFYYLC